MSFIMSIIRNMIPKESPIFLGRWKIEYCKVKINDKVKLANEDHCGTCSQYSSDKISDINKQNENKGIFK